MALAPLSRTVWRQDWLCCWLEQVRITARWTQLRQAWAAFTPLQRQRRRTLLAVAVALVCWLLRPLVLFSWLPGWLVGALLLWATVELALLAWRPKRWR